MENNIIEQESQLFMQTYKRLPLVVEKAEGVYVYTKDGKQYLDFLGGIAVNTLGHCNPKINQAMKIQMERYSHLSNYFYQDTQINFAKKLIEATAYSKVFLANSGTEANEGAIKIARRWGAKNNKSNLIAFSGGFHGRTYGSLSIMDKPTYKDKMGPFLGNTSVLKYNDISDLQNSIDDNTSAIFLEFIQGEGGITAASNEWIEQIKKLKEQYNFLIIADEVQSGVGRTGKFFGFEHYNLKPDVVTVAKGIGGGLPLGVILVNSALDNIFDKGNHGTTFGGNALACASGIVVIDELKNWLLQHVIAVGNYFIEKLNTLHSRYPDLIKEIRGIGLMNGIVLSFDAAILVDLLLKNGVIANATSGNVLRLLPPLIIEKEHIDTFIDKIELSLNKISL